MGLPFIQANHALALEPASRVLALDGNPVFDGIARVADDLGDRLVCVNEVQVEGKLLACSVGRWRAALEGVLEWARLVHVRQTQRKDLLVASVTGPLGENLYQAEKGIKNSEDLVERGGAVVLHAPCGGGTGQARFLELLARAPTHEQCLALVRSEGYRLGDHKAVKLRALQARGVSWHLAAPSIPRDSDAFRSISAAGLSIHSTLEEALERAGREKRRALLVEDAGNLVARAIS